MPFKRQVCTQRVPQRRVLSGSVFTTTALKVPEPYKKCKTGYAVLYVSELRTPADVFSYDQVMYPDLSYSVPDTNR